jgi:phosphomannomutase
MNKFIFDVDGTLTPSRRNINSDFQRWFLDFCYSNKVYLVTGSDYPKTLEQLGQDICETVETVYNCNGNDIWQHGTNISSAEWRIPDNARDWLTDRLTNSDFPKRTGLHFEHRPGMVNFSIVGRNANAQERAHYVKWDKDTNERNDIAETFNQLFSDLEAKVGGETGIDIGPQGTNKSQILKDFFDNDVLYFFGDAMYEGGNDEPLAKSIVDNNLGYCYNIQNWQQTWTILKEHDN